MTKKTMLVLLILILFVNLNAAYAIDEDFERGNSVGNINNWGYYASTDDWIYYSSFSQAGGLYKIKKDGSEKTKIIDGHPAYINIKDEYFYYSDGWKLTRVKLDGSDKQVLANSAFHVNVKGEYIYYTNNGYQDGFIFKMKTDGSEKKQLNNDHASQIVVSGDSIYYTSYYNKLIKVDLEGQSKKKLLTGKQINDLNIDGDWMYFNFNQKLYKMKIDGTELTKLSDDNPKFINVNGDWIYYSDVSKKQNLVRVKKDGTNRAEINQIKSWYISIVDNYLFFHDLSKMVKLDINKIETNKE